MNQLLLALILVAVAAVLVAVDMFLPTGGVLAVLAAVAAGAAVVCGFLHSVTAGSWIGVGVLAAIPLSFWIFVKAYPNTPIGRQMIMQPQDAEPYDFGGGGASRETLLNQVGLAATDLGPSGVITIDGRRYEASSIDGLIRAGTAIRVKDVEMGLLEVEIVREPSPTPLAGSPRATRPDAASNRPAADLASAAAAKERPSSPRPADAADGATPPADGSLLDVPPDLFAVDELLEEDALNPDELGRPRDSRRTGESAS